MASVVSGIKNGEVCDHFVDKAKELVEDKVTKMGKMWLHSGWEEKKQPEWFKEKGNHLKEQIDKRIIVPKVTEVYQKWTPAEIRHAEVCKFSCEEGQE